MELCVGEGVATGMMCGVYVCMYVRVFRLAYRSTVDGNGCSQQ